MQPARTGTRSILKYSTRELSKFMKLAGNFTIASLELLLLTCKYDQSQRNHETKRQPTWLV